MAAVAAVAAFGLTAACSSGGGGNPSATGTGKPSAPVGQQANVVIGTAADSVGPAKPVPGAKTGGTLNVLHRRDFAHLDPARTYVGDQMTMAELLTRRLTYYKKDGDKTVLIGDLATDAGTTTDGGKTWKYTLKDNIKFEDGSPITSADVKYGVERTFVQDYAEGPTWIQTWLAGSEKYWEFYPGPYGGKELPNDVVETPDAKTIIFHCKDVEPDFPFAASMGMTAAVPKSKDTKEEYDKHPFASGPYKIAEHVVDKSITLVKNDAWDPKTDAARHQYVDQFKFELGVAAPVQLQRVIAAKGSDATAMVLTERLDSNTANQVMNDPALKARATDGVGPYTNYWTINTRRIPDKQVRLAILTAFPRQQARLAEGGPVAGDFATTLGSPNQLGWAKYPSPLDSIPPTGDPEKAKQILTAAGKIGQPIVFGYAPTAVGQARAVAIKEGLDKAGFKVELKELPDKEYQDVISLVDKQIDIHWNGWGADWPTGSTVYTPVFDGRKIVDKGQNLSLYSNPAVDSEIDRILKITDPQVQGAEWMKLDQKIMDDIPVVPYIYQRHVLMYGPNIGGAGVNAYGAIDLNNVFVKA
ncbi:ABC transporter substrate-binding protein [Yinghuangia seranimata]|uniref:ABC transporter substrate-binding protein n=1 Tax=Yinghuangia seranimata TaxID=408067 RepID=UPI00248C6D2C|nr:ABC transporter substrate-binding protein [Yinghuangia seranimata]MDI2128914.1 ABC transporter substrate-binding protein [Yinghuangia seranimata]